MFDRPRVRVQIGDPMGKVASAIAATALVASALAARREPRTAILPPVSSGDWSAAL